MFNLMKKKSIALLFLISFLVQLQAQEIKSRNDAKKQLLFEKLYVHVDREFYSPGDVIWMKVYQVNGITNQLNANYRNIFVQLVSDKGKVVQDIILFSINGQAAGEFRTDSLLSGMYTIRATTKFLENFGEDACFHQKIWIDKSMKSPEVTGIAQPDDSKIDVAFLPEGGNLVLNALNTVAFKAINLKGRGIYVSGQIRNDRGDTLTTFTTTYLGMGKFKLMPQDGTSYYAILDQYPGLKIPLPQAGKDGLCMNCRAEGESLLLDISSNMKGSSYPVFYFIASHKGAVLFRQKIRMADYAQSIKVNKSMFPDGISKVTLVDTIMAPMAERLLYIDNSKGDLLSLHLNRPEFKPREAVKIDADALLEPGDTINSNMLVAVVNRNYFSNGESNQNIKSYLLLDSDLKGAIESPASYFVDDKYHTSAEKLDLLMLVHGWRTYIWDDVVKTPSPSLEDWNDAGITVSGRVKKLLWKGPVPGASVALDYVYKKFRIGETTTDAAGRFAFKHIYLLDALKVMLNARAKDGSRNAEILLDPAPIKDSVILSTNSTLDIDLNSDFMRENSVKRIKEMQFNPQAGSILLAGIDVVTKKNDAMMRSGGIYSWADNTLTITRKDYSFLSLIDYLRAKIPSFTDYGDDVELRGKPVKFMVDGLDTTYRLRDIRTLQMNEIETIDILNPGFRIGFSPDFLGNVNQSGLIAIYKKTTPDVMQSDIYVKGRLVPDIKGFTLPKKFYSPEYTLENITTAPFDFRPTLYWNPDVNFENGKSTIDFFTSDIPADYIVYVEGITKKGKICFGTTHFKVNKN
jgi:hypothetical protein